jgi:hypothetical protein
MPDDLGKQGSRPGSTFQEMRAKARAGSLAGKSYPGDALRSAPSTASEGAKAARVGQGSGVVKRSPIGTPNTGNSPYERQSGRKPGAESIG